MFLALYFFEALIQSLVKRRETTVKKNINLLREVRQPESVNKEEEVEEQLINPAISAEEPKVTRKKSEHEYNELQIDTVNNDLELNENLNPTPLSDNKRRRVSRSEVAPVIQQENLETFSKKKRKATAKDLKEKNWKQKCYICSEYGDLICCDGCNNVAHLFCACLTVVFILK